MQKLVDENTIGEILSFNGRIGHNGELKTHGLGKELVEVVLY